MQHMDPLVFEPYLRPMVWGSRRLERYGKRLPTEGTYGESWEISGHPHHVSRVADGPLQGKSLDELCTQFPRELFGNSPALARFPLLIKLLDCHDWLSVQVHPTDELAARLLPGELGKTEAWVVLAAEAGARIYAGLKPGVTRSDLEQHLAAGTVQECLHQFQPRPGDCIFLLAGTVHAVGGGVVMAEVQQTSDATFRLFDWNRLGSDGKPRALHVCEALESINWNAGPVHPVTPEALPNMPDGVRGDKLVRCRYFALERFTLSGSLPLPSPGRLSIWQVLDGSAALHSAAGQARTFRRGETVLVPAAANDLTWTCEKDQRGSLLGIWLPESA
jgi:mannose-6-phosphate isomerase